MILPILTVTLRQVEHPTGNVWGTANANVIDPKRLCLWDRKPSHGITCLPRQAGFMLHGVNFRHFGGVEADGQADKICIGASVARRYPDGLLGGACRDSPLSPVASSWRRCRTAWTPETVNPPCDITCSNKPAGSEPAVDGGAHGVGPSADTEMQ